MSEARKQDRSKTLQAPKKLKVNEQANAEQTFEHEELPFKQAATPTRNLLELLNDVHMPASHSSSFSVPELERPTSHAVVQYVAPPAPQAPVGSSPLPSEQIQRMLDQLDVICKHVIEQKQHGVTKVTDFRAKSILL